MFQQFTGQAETPSTDGGRAEMLRRIEEMLFVGDLIDWDRAVKTPAGEQLVLPGEVGDLALAAGQANAPTKEKRPMKPKINRKGDTYVPAGYDLCQTPAYALAPLLPYLKAMFTTWTPTIWESACGDGNLVRGMEVVGLDDVLGTDLLTGTNFFEWQPDNWHVQVTNPPYSIKYKWIKRSYELGKPFALLLPLETLGAISGQKLFAQYGMELLLLDRRVNFGMPERGFADGLGWKSSAQFPVAWFTWQLNLPSAITYGKLPQAIGGPAR